MLLLILVLTTVFEVVCVLGTLPQNVTLGRTTCQCTLKTHMCTLVHTHTCAHTHYVQYICTCCANAVLSTMSKTWNLRK